MKKIMIFAALATAALAAFSCTAVEQDVLTNDDVLVLSLSTGDMATRTDDAEPDFENDIDHFDFFFFSDAAGTTPIRGMHGRAVGASKKLDTQEGAEFAALRSITSYVYILANYPEAIDHTVEWTLADLLALEVDSKILTEKKKALNETTNKMEETGEVVFTENLVMDSWRVENNADVYTTELTPKMIQEDKKITIPLARLAAKIVVHVNVDESVTIGEGTDEEYVWESHPELLRVYYVNALNNKATVAGTPVKRSALTDETGYEYLTYPTPYGMTPAPAAGVYEYETEPFYTYPQEWTSGENGEPYIKIQMPWMNEQPEDTENPDPDASPSLGSSNFYYKLMVPTPETDGKWTLKRNTCYTVNVTLSMLNPQDEYIPVEYGITVVPWADSGRPGGSGLSAARFFSVPTREFDLYNDESLEIPFSSSSAVTAFFTEIKYQYFGTNAGATYTFSYTEADNKTNFTLPNKDSGNQTVADAAKDTHPYSVTVANKYVLFEHEISNIFTARDIKVTIKSTSGKPEDVAVVIIHQHPAIEIKKHPTMNMFINGWFGHVQNPKAADGTPSARNHQFTDYYGNVCYASSRGYTTTATYNSGNEYWKTTKWGALATNKNTMISEPYLTEVVVSAFSESNHSYQIRYGGDYGSQDHDITNPTDPQPRDYKIGDPRVKASAAGLGSSWLYNGYLYKEDSNGEEDVRPWQNEGDIMIGSMSESARTFVAPRFLLSSTLNVTEGIRFAGAQRRAAVYQEDGYPAGRWRLPTEAEICFIIDRQNDGSLPQLLRKDQYYWCADGNVIYTGHTGLVPGSATPSSTRNAPLRFIYDLWYWGDMDESLDKSIYHPNMHLVTPNPGN